MADETSGLGKRVTFFGKTILPKPEKRKREENWSRGKTAGCGKNKGRSRGS